MFCVQKVEYRERMKSAAEQLFSFAQVTAEESNAKNV